MDKLLWRISLSETGEQQFKVSIIGPDEMVIAHSSSPQVAYDNAVAKLVVKPWLVNDGDYEVTIASLRVRDLAYFDLLKRVDSYFSALYYRHRDKGSISGQLDSKLQEILGELRATVERRKVEQ